MVALAVVLIGLFLAGLCELGRRGAMGGASRTGAPRPYDWERDGI